ncbi:DUF4201 domain containing protein, partial [Asbolus verrucosus]
MDSSVRLVVHENNQNKFKLLDVYNPGFQLGEKAIINEVGFWNGNNLNIYKNVTFYRQRRNMTSITLRSGSVVLVSNHSESFEEYMLDPRYKQFDTMSKFHYPMFLLLEEVWYLIIVSTLLICIFLKILYAVENKFVGSRSTYSWAIVILITSSTLFHQGVSVFPAGHAGRMVFITHLFMSILLFNYYTSSIISSLLSRPPQSFQTLYELGHSKLEIEIEDLSYTITWFEIMNDSDVQYYGPKKSQYKELFYITFRMIKQAGLIYDQLTNQCQEEKTKNNYLQRKVVEYYKKRKMFHVLYEGKLTTERTQLKCKLLSVDEAQALFEKFQSNELELGKEFENTNAKGVTSEKIVERYLKRQKNQLAHIIKMRLDYIKMKNRCNEKMKAIDALNILGPDLHLIDYEQLKFDNRSLHDRLEERKNELTKIRLKCQNARVREKSSDVDININYLHEKFQTVSNEYEDVREQFNSLKQERYMIRSSINKMKDKSGLLTKPKLLSDKESATAEIMSLSKKVKKLKLEHQPTTQIVDKMRKVMGSTKKLNKLKAKVEGKQEQVKALFEKLRRTESDVVNEFITPNEDDKNKTEKIVERYLRRQKLDLENLMKLRLNYIKCKNAFAEKQDHLNALHNLGPNFHLMDYEQLKLDNTNLHDKLEEREMELTKIHAKCQNAMQNMVERFESVSGEYEDVREQLNYLKQKRDLFRQLVTKKQAQSGLLAKPKLLRDMESAMTEVNVVSEKLEDFRQECMATTNQ